MIEAVGSYGDVLPCFALARELLRRGEDVHVAASGYFEEDARRAGVPLAPIGTREDYERLIQNPALWHPRKSIRVLAKAVAEALPYSYAVLERLHLPGETLVAGVTLAFAARCLQEKLGCPGASIHFSPSVFRSIHDPPRLPGLPDLSRIPRPAVKALYFLADRLFTDPILGPGVNRFRRSIGLPPVRRFFDDWIHAPDLVLGMFPDWLASPQPGWPRQTRLTGFPLFDEALGTDLPAEAEAFLASGPPPIVVAAGTAMAHGRDYFETSGLAIARAGLRGLLLTRFTEQVPASLPPGIRRFDLLPFSKVLPRAAALIHHGGVGTSSQALRAGIPQIVRPLAFDQFDNAARLERLGVARVLSRRKYGAPRLAPMLRDWAMAKSTRARCGEAAAKLRGADMIKEACDRLLACMKRKEPP